MKMQWYMCIQIKKELSLEKLNNLELKNTKIINKYKITRGSYTHLLAIYELLKLAIADNHVHYIHIISGQDVRVKT